MDRNEKERQVAELTERLRTSDTLIVADYRGLTMTQIDALRTRLLEQGARFTVVKNTLTRRAAEAAGADSLLALLEGPTAIAFLESDGDPAAVAKALQDAARETQVLAIRGGVLQGRAVTSDEIAELATLPSVEILRGQVLGAITAPLTTMIGLFTAPLHDLVGLIDARIEQLAESAPADSASSAPEDEAAPSPDAEGGAQAEPAPEADESQETATSAQAEPERTNAEE
jgi:large subunit ribosomal protein L10